MRAAEACTHFVELDKLRQVFGYDLGDFESLRGRAGPRLPCRDCDRCADTLQGQLCDCLVALGAEDDSHALP